jgi:hypothetical protein
MGPKLTWTTLVAEVAKKEPDLYMYCASCSKPLQCSENLEINTPIEIKILNACCACVFQLILEDFNVPTLFLETSTGENESIYILADVLLDITESQATVVPLDKVNDYLEYMKEIDEEKAEKIMLFLSEALKMSR